jgi:hypothetical protein
VTQRDSLVRFAASPQPPCGQGKTILQASLSRWKAPERRGVAAAKRRRANAHYRPASIKGHLTATRAYAWTATRAYAWSSPIEGSEKRRFFAVLHQGPVTSPVEAVRAAIVAEQRGTP